MRTVNKIFGNKKETGMRATDKTAHQSFLSFRELLLLLSGSSIVASLFIVSPLLREGILIAKENWFFHTSIIFCTIAFGVLLSEKRKTFPSFQFTDGIVMAFSLWILFTYDFGLDPDPIKLGWVLSLAILWFFFRAILSHYPRLNTYFLYVLTVFCLLESIIGLGQLYGIWDSYHGKSRISGSFFNPGPYAGYIALIFPLVFNNVLKWHKQKPNSLSSKIAMWICVGTLLSVLLVLPATMSRAAWIAVLFSSFLLLVKHFYKKDFWKTHGEKKYLKFIGVVIIGLSIVTGCGAAYFMKKDSADGRIFIWQRTTSIIHQNPLIGVGMGSFASSYGNVQSDYFASKEASQQEERIAGCPTYAFNEYLQICAETGIPGLLLFILFLSFSLYNSIKGGKWGVAGSLVAFMIFAFFSYPLSLLPFPVTLLLLSAIAQNSTESNCKAYLKRQTLFFSFFLTLLFIGAVGIGIWQKDRLKYFERWEVIRKTYQSKDYDKAVREYKDLSQFLYFQPAFIYEFAHCLSQTGSFIESNSQLEHLAQISCNPMIFNKMGLNYQALGEFSMAETCFYRALHLLPNRLYPYYLLAKLYAEPNFYNRPKLIKMAQIVLNKEAKVDSPAIQEMKSEMETLLKENSIAF